MQTPAFDLPEITDVGDKQLVRNVLTVLWSMNMHGGSCLSWQVQQRKDGFLVLVSFGTTFSVAVQDMQMVMDVSPMRVVSVTVRNPENNTIADGKAVGAVLAVKVLDKNQPIVISETEILRIRKKRKFWFGSD